MAKTYLSKWEAGHLAFHHERARAACDAITNNPALRRMLCRYRLHGLFEAVVESMRGRFAEDESGDQIARELDVDRVELIEMTSMSDEEQSSWDQVDNVIEAAMMRHLMALLEEIEAATIEVETVAG